MVKIEFCFKKNNEKNPDNRKQWTSRTKNY